MLRSSVIQLVYSAVSLLARGDRSLSAINATMGIVRRRRRKQNGKKRIGGLGEGPNDVVHLSE
jgi:hypothetical protein